MLRHITTISFAAVILGLIIFIVSSCDRNVNSVEDPHFAPDGAPLDTTILFFTPTSPTEVKLFIETSGSMNGFFRANQANSFKKTVWSVFSGLASQSQGKVYTMSNGGDVDGSVSLEEFRERMNSGQFVSNSSTHIPAMLHSIIRTIDPSKGQAAVLVSDMKYSPTGKAAAVELSQYQEQIRNEFAHGPGVSVSFVCATSEFLSKDGSVSEPRSPYYYIIIGASENVAQLRNDIARWCEEKDTYIESGDIGMDYHTPQYDITEVQNGSLSTDYPKTLITDFARAVSDTCSFVLRIHMNGFPWNAVDATILPECLSVKTLYGANISATLLTGEDHLKDDHSFEKRSERKSYADFLVKVYDWVMDDEVVEWYFVARPLDDRYCDDFLKIYSAPDEGDLWGSFSFKQFIKGVYDAKLNTSDATPVRILLSSFEN